MGKMKERIKLTTCKKITIYCHTVFGSSPHEMTFITNDLCYNEVVI